MVNIFTVLLTIFMIGNSANCQKLIIPMDQTQTDHLKAYGVAFWSLKQGENVDWLLNFRGGSFLINQNYNVERELKLRGVYFESVNASILTQIFATIEANNMDLVL